ncbi:MAG: hypothetical protein LBK47_00715 [Prevotellaceae bacterium]|jgi:hypothetical protein|nr:hypothetical protein [Prevotellaceae bacterium]
MKIKTAFLSTFLLLTTFAIAQEKVAEKSGSKPKWAADFFERDYIITSADGNTMQEAQQQAVTLVKQEVVRSVAESVISAGTLNKSEDMGGNVSSSFRQSIMSKANKVPYVQGISLSTAEASYWEKITDKKAKRTFYRFYIKIPFSRAQLGKLIAEYKSEDQKLTDQLDKLEQDLNAIASVEQIDGAISDLKSLQSMFEDKRADRAALLITRYTSQYASIVMEDAGSALGQIKYSLKLNGRVITVARKPQALAGCTTVTNMSVSSQPVNVISYSSDGCYNDQENFFEVKYRFGNVNVAKKFLVEAK